MRGTMVPGLSLISRRARLSAATAVLLTLVFAGRADWPGAPQPVLAAETGVSLVASPTSVVVGQSVTFTATIACAGANPFDPFPDAPSGTVTFRNTDTNAVLGTVGTVGLSSSTAQATFTTWFTNEEGPFGEVHNVAASFTDTSAGTCEDGTSNTASVSVTAAPSTTTLFTLTDDDGYVGFQPQFSVRVERVSGPIGESVPLPVGSAILLHNSGSGWSMMDSKPLVGDHADFETLPLGAGTHQFRGVFSPDGFNFETSESNIVTVEVYPFPTDVTITTLPSGPLGPGGTAQIGVRLENPELFYNVETPRTGTVTLKIGDDTTGTATVDGSFVDGDVLVDVDGIVDGTHNVTAIYSGDVNFESSTSAAAPWTIDVLDQYPTEVTFKTVPAAPLVPNATTGIVVTLGSSLGGATTPRTGTVQLRVDGSTVATATLDGSFVDGDVTVNLDAAALGAGTHEVVAVYSGDANFASGTTVAAATIEVLAKFATTVSFIVAPSSPILEGSDAEYSILMRTTGTGLPERTGTLILAVDGTPVATWTFADGVSASFVSVTRVVEDIPVGDHVVTATYSGDENFGGAVATRNLTVQAVATGFAITSVDDIAVDGDATGSPVTYATPTASHSDGPVTVTCTHASGAQFPVGVTTVTCTATDPNALPTSVSTSFDVTVRYGDLTITPLDAVTTTATGPGGAVVTFPVPVASDVNGTVAVVCSHESGSIFSIGTHTVACGATQDGVYPDQVVTTAVFAVLADETPPVFSGVPDDITTAATSADGAVVSYAAPTATDAVTGAAAVTCTPASGSTFAPGVTTVTCTASDSSGNEASATFTVDVGPMQPVVSAISPSTGPQAGGDTVTLTGEGLAGATVHFGTTPAAVLSNTDTEVQVAVPSGTGAVDVTVTTAGGTSAPIAYTYAEPEPPEDEGQGTPTFDEPGVTAEVEERETVRVTPSRTVVLETKVSDGASAKVVAPRGALPPGSLLSVGAITNLDTLIEQAPLPSTTGVVVAFQVNAARRNGEAITGDFGAPVELSFTVPASQVPAEGAHELTVIFWNGTNWVEEPATLTVEEDGSVTLTARVDHFTIFAITRQPGYRTFRTPLIPAGITLTTWGGGTIQDAASVSGVRALWAWRDGRAFGYIGGAPTSVNESFLALFAGDMLPASTPLVVVTADE